MEEQAQEAPVETGMLGGTTEADFEKPSEEQDASVDVFETKTEETPKLQRPEDLPAEFWDEENGTFKANDLFEEYKKEKDKALGLRQKLSKGAPAAPESPDAYQIDSTKMAEETGVEIPENDPGLNIFKQVAFENGLDQEKFENIVHGYMKASMNSKELQEMSQPQGPSEEDQKAYRDEEMKKLGDNAQGQIQGIKNWNQQLFYDGVLSKEDFETAQNMGMSAKEIRVINAYRQAAGNMTIPEVSSPIDGAPSEQEIQKIIASPEYASDPVLQKKVTDYYQQKYS